jgi:hypothetical protein
MKCKTVAITNSLQDWRDRGPLEDDRYGGLSGETQRTIEESAFLRKPIWLGSPALTR